MEAEIVFTIIATSVAFLLIMVGGMLFMYSRCYRRVPPGRALVVTTPRGLLVVLDGGILVYPTLNTAEEIDLSFRALRVELSRTKTRDDVLIDVTATFRLRVNATSEDIEQVARKVGCARAVEEATLRDLFQARCQSALTSAVHEARHDDLDSELEDRALKNLGTDLAGYVLDGIGIESVKRVD